MTWMVVVGQAGRCGGGQGAGPGSVLNGWTGWGSGFGVRGTWCCCVAVAVKAGKAGPARVLGPALPPT